MITVSNVSVQFGKRVLFNDVNLKVYKWKLLWYYRCQRCRKIYLPACHNR